jgi:phosphonatase-like hydrolase
MYSIDLVVFDMAGTTIRDDDAVNRVFRTVMESEGLTITESDANAVMGLPKPVSVRLLLEKYGRPVNPQVVERLHRRFVDQMLEYYRTYGAEAAPGAEDALVYLKERGIAVYLDTGFSRNIADVILERLRWRERGWIAGSVTSDEVERGRPFPDMIHVAMAATGVSNPARVAKVGDTPSDLNQGRAARCALIVGVLSGASSRDELLIHPHHHLIPDVSFFPAVLEGRYDDSFVS